MLVTDFALRWFMPGGMLVEEKIDTIPLNEWRAGISKLPSTARRARLLSAMEDSLIVGIESPSMGMCATIAEAEALAAKVIAHDGEGICLKDPHSPYECLRSASWLKTKGARP